METWLPSQQLGSTEMDVPHVGRAPGSWSHASPRGWGTRWGLSQALVAHPGLPSLEALCSLIFCFPENPGYSLAQCFQDLFCFWKTAFQKCLCKKFLLITGPAEISKLYPCTICYEVNATLEIPAIRKHPRLRLSLIPWEFYLWCGKRTKPWELRADVKSLQSLRQIL